MFFSPIWTIFELVRHINKTNVLNNFHDDSAKIVTSRVFTKKTAPPTGGHLHEDWALNVTSTVIKLDRDIIGTNLLTKFHEDRTINVASRVYTNNFGRTDDGQRPQSGKPPCPPGNHVFQRTGTIFKLNTQTNTTNVLTNFHDDWAKIMTSRVFTMKTAPPTGGHVFQRTGTTFELNQHIIKTNILINFEIDRYFIGTKLLTKFHEDRTTNVASRVFTNKCRQTDGRTTDKDRSQKLT
ncbi:hypothetical protein DPMN_009591 [Dreissena polymorpha]|uniref:Uncharacterized protein n=1 Tax=Dreissena polymorpha TaxID=45954 RepID=A0A9D4N0Q8_DREPO|nr:hypothetical protein DPMN_009591 [Dreissena polymorpha]